MYLVWVAIAWMIGIALGLGGDRARSLALLAWIALATLALAALVPRFRPALLFVALALGCCGLGAWRGGLVQHPPAELPPGTITAMRGEVRDWPIRGDRSDTAIVAVDAVRIGDRWSPGTALVRADLPAAPAVGAGDQIEVIGDFRPNTAIELAGFRDYLARQGLHGQFRGYRSTIVASGERADLFAWRANALAAVKIDLRRHIPGAEGALVTGVLVGDDRLLPPATRDAFKRTGTAHIMALSGWNVALVAGLCALIGRWLRRGRSIVWLFGSAVAIWAFVLFVGGGASLVRAAIMGTLYLLAEALGRRGDALSALALAAIGMTLYDPGTILDIGFQLSCAATIGLIVVSPHLAAGLERMRLPKLLAAPTAATLAAELATSPLSLHHFGQFSLVTLPTNLLVEWPVPLIMIGGVATAVVGIIPGPLADLCGLLTWLPARAMLLSVEQFGGLPWATRTIPAPGWPIVAALYAALATILSAGWWSVRLRLGVASADVRLPSATWPILGGALGALVLWSSLLLFAR